MFEITDADANDAATDAASMPEKKFEEEEEEENNSLTSTKAFMNHLMRRMKMINLAKSQQHIQHCKKLEVT